jgi:hypothetical protein
MKILVLLWVGIVLSIPVSGQITITTSDLTAAGDTFRVSNGIITPTIDPAPTGANYTWDYSTLQWITQEVDSFISVSSTGTIYSLVFANIAFNPNRSNQASIGPDLPSVPQLTITDVYYFYYNSSNAYDVKGYGANLNGFSTPLPFNNPDRILDFPVDFGNMDSSDSDYSLAVPGLGGYSHVQHRVNEVDGWGSLTTPYGTFNTLRVKSIITGRDSIDLDTLGGFGFELPLTTEYKWYGTGQGIPLLQINTTTTFGFEAVTSIVYRDSVREFTSGLHDLNPGAMVSAAVYPNPVQSTFVVDVGFQNSTSATIDLTGIDGRQIAELYHGTLPAGTSRLYFDAEEKGIASGLYFIRVRTGAQTKVLQLLVQ